ncbi:hypothetical protein KP79_PYT04778 [Mizuhopecten yessoensis]|uniref:Uncharacterized protein n=1 Tax=Mizuhopecten yessoensis TaxID=6573 RepID=A0A210PXC3_MIZYE|nr:hypothetical protein KP79_PYT04778 [Mizuhopecten yessoensis]
MAFRRHTWWKIFLIFFLLCPITFAFLVSQFGQQIGMLKRSTVETFNTFRLEIIPIDVILVLWFHLLVYIWHLMWIIYVIVCIFRKTTCAYIYQLPVYPSAMLILMAVNLFANAGWLIAFDQYVLEGSLILSVLSFFSLSVSLCLAYKHLHDLDTLMRRLELQKDIWLIRILIHEGLAFYGALLVTSTLINLCMCMSFRWNVGHMLSCLIALSLLGSAMFTWFFLDNVLFPSYTQWTLSPYIVFIVTLCGMLYRSYDLRLRFSVSVFLVCLLVFASLALGTKIATLGYRLCMANRKKKEKLLSGEHPQN